MRVTVPILVNSNALIGRLGFTLGFDPTRLAYKADQQSVLFNPSLNTNSAYVAFGSGYIAPYIENVELQPGNFNLCNVLLDTVAGAGGSTQLQIDGHIQPFVSSGPSSHPDYPALMISASGGTVDLASGTATPIVINVGLSSLQNSYISGGGDGVVSNPLASPAIAPPANSVGNIVDHAAGAISTVTTQIGNIISGLTDGIAAPLSSNVPNAVPQAPGINSVSSNVQPYLPLIGLGVLVYLLVRK